MASLELRNVQKSYGNSQIATLKDIALKIDAGEFLILVGPSGCGKSTLMNCIAGLENITGGEILVDGEDISQASPKDRDIAMVFQSYAIFPHLTVAQNVAFGLRRDPRGKAEKAALVEEALAMVGLAGDPVVERGERVRRHLEEEDGEALRLLYVALTRALGAGFTQEGDVREADWGRIVQIADPFGHGWCLLQFLGRGYDAIATPAG